MSDIETRAKEMGWSPKEEFRGDPEKWIDAETYVERGETLLPIVRANNKKLEGEVASLRGQLAQTQNLLKASAEAIEALKEFNSTATRKAAETRKGELIEAIKEARTDGDVEHEEALREQLDETKAALKTAESTKPVVEKPATGPEDFTQTPEWKAWMKDNDWFTKDRRRTSIMLALADELRRDPETSGLVGRAFLDRVNQEVDKVLGTNNARRNAPGKIEEGARPPGGEGSANGKTFADLPANAKEACDKLAPRLVGEGRAHKDMASWRKAYVQKYFEE